MDTWLNYLRSGLKRQPTKDRIAGAGSDWRASLSVLRPFLVKHWQKGILGAILILSSGLLALPQPLLNRYLIDNVVLAKRLDLLPLVILLMIAVQLSGMGADLFQQFFFGRLAQEVLSDLQQSLFDRTLRLPKTFFDEKETGYLLARLSSDVEGLRWFFSSSIVYIASNILTFIGGAIFLFYLEWRLAIATLIVLPVLIAVVRYFSSHTRILGHQGMEQWAVTAQRIQETLASIPLIKSFATEKRESKRMMDEVRKNRQIQMEQTVLSSLANLFIGILPSLARFLVLIVGAYLIIKGQWTLGSLLAFQSYLGYVYSPATSLAQANLQLQNSMAALERVSALYSTAPEENITNGKRVMHLQGDVSFENVAFSYSGRDEVLRDISFQVSPGEHIAIAGPSGVGKTTLISLILRFYRPSRGEIYFDGQPAGEFELESLRKRIGYVAQTNLLMEGTILDNLLYGNPEATQAEIEQATQAAEIHTFIESLPERYGAIIGERGVNLSEGQKQRLSIARALIKQPDILVFDEPTSALDSIIEKSIFEALPMVVQGKTLFVVAHRLTTIQKADRILLIKDGELQSAGTHLELLEKNPYYQSLFL